MKAQKYKYIFQAEGEDPVLVIHTTRPGDAENCARKMARLVAKKTGAASVRCLWKGPIDEKIPGKIREELGKEPT